MLERRPDTMQAAVVNNLFGFVEPVVSSRSHQDGSSSPVCWKSLDSEYINSNLHVILASTFVGCHTYDGFPPTNSFSSLTIDHKHYAASARSPYVNLSMGQLLGP